MYVVVTPRVALKKAAGTGYTVLSKWPFSHSSMERSLRYVEILPDEWAAVIYLFLLP